MADEPPLTAEMLRAALDDETKTYAMRRSALEASLAGMVAEPGEKVDELLSLADEFGREHAIELFADSLHTHPISPEQDEWPSRAERVAHGVDAVLDSQDRVDELTDRREKLLGRAENGPRRVINVHGEEIEIDALARKFRVVGQDTFFDIGHEPELSLTQQISQDHGAGQAEPRPHNKDRSRNR